AGGSTRRGHAVRKSPDVASDSIAPHNNKDYKMTVGTPTVEGDEFTNSYEELQFLCRHAKRTLATALAHLNETPGLEKKVQALYVLGGKGAEGEKKFVKALEKQIELID